MMLATQIRDRETTVHKLRERPFPPMLVQLVQLVQVVQQSTIEVISTLSATTRLDNVSNGPMEISIS